MAVINTRIRVAADGSVSVADPLPQGDYAATLTMSEPTHKRRSVRDLPVHLGPWDDGASLRREDLYGDDGS